MANAGTVEVDVRANSSQFVREMRRTRQETQRTNRQLQTFAKNFRASIIVGLGVAGVEAMRRWTRQLGDSARAIDDFSGRIGVSGTDLQRWQQTAELAGIQTNTFNLALQRSTRRAAEAARGTGEARQALRELGIDAERFGQLGLDDRLFDLKQAFEAVDDPARRLALGFKIFDSEGTAVLDLLRNLDTELLRSRQVWDEETRQELADANIELEKFGQTMTILAGNTIGFVSTEGLAFINWLSEITEDIGEFIEAANQASGLSANRQRAQAGRRRANRGGPAPRISPSVSVISPNRETSLTDTAREGLTIQESILGVLVEQSMAAAETLRIEAERNELWAGVAEQQRVASEVRLMNIKRTEETERAFLDEVAADIEALRQQRDDFKDGFITLFTDNMVQAADSGFASLLQSWTRTLQQMAARLIASKVFDFLGNLGGGGQGSIGAAFQDLGGLFEFHNGGVVPGVRGQERLILAKAGETVLPTHKSGAMGGVVNNYNFSGGITSADRAEIAAMIEAGSQATQASIRDQVRRGRFV